MRHDLLTLLLGPVLLSQGRLVRQRTRLLPEPPGDREGVTGEGPPLRLLIIGDSAAAGVGTSHQNEALLGRTVALLSRTRRVTWSLQARSGATTAATLRRLARKPGRPFDVVVTSLGVNDVTGQADLEQWRIDQSDLRNRLRELYAPQLIVVSAVPPLDRFPALPQPLRWHLGRQAAGFNRALAADLQDEADCRLLVVKDLGGRADMAVDGFHPGPRLCERWAAAIADLAADIPAGTGREF